MGRHSWWNLGWGARMVCRQVPEEMDAVENAKKCRAPALFIESTSDRVVPPKYQRMIVDAYGGPAETFRIEGADHHTPLDESQAEAYVESVRTWSARL